MERTRFDYSLKNIPCPKLHNFLIDLTDKTVLFIRRLRWKVLHFNNGTVNDNNSDDKYGFKSQKNPPSIKHLEKFEEDLFNMIKEIKFRNNSDEFQTQLMRDVKSIRNSKQILVKADKSKYLYKVEPSNYKSMLLNKITNDYKLDTLNTIESINTDAYTIANKLKIEDRVGKFAQKEAYILLKDHKADFINKKQSRLINPAKTEVGLVSQQIIKGIVVDLIDKLGHNLWANTDGAIKWFQQIPGKIKATFIQFDIVDFYPSITEKILEDAIQFASSHTKITPLQVDIIKACRRTALVHDRAAWIKKDNSTQFDVPMGGVWFCPSGGSHRCVYFRHIE